MSTKLTLTIDKQVIERAKIYASEQGRSLSNLIENYLKSLTSPEMDDEDDFDYSPKVRTLWGAIDLENKDIDYEKILEDELMRKYMP